MPARLVLSSCCAIILLAAAARPSLAENWSQFRGQGGNATAANAQTPLNWSATKNIAWKSALPGRGASSPVTWGDRVFLTAYTGFGTDETNTSDKSKLRLHVICVDRRNGEINWDRSIPASEHTQKFSRRIQDHGYATNTPVTDGKAVYAFFGVSGVVAYDFDGNQLWQATVGTGTAGFGSASSPVVFENLLLVNASIESKTVFAFDKKSGREVWKIPEINRAWTTPCVAAVGDGTSELIINQKDVIYGFDPKTGKRLWSCDAIDDYIVPVPISHDGIVYCLGGRTNRCVAIKLGGRGDVTESHKLWQVNVGANVTSPIYYDGHLYWASDKAVANCLNAKTGESVYRKRLETRARIYASIIRAGERLYVTTRDQGVVVLAAKPEYKQLAVNTIETDESMLNASPAVIGNQLLLRTDSFLYCIGDPGQPAGK
jgi:outer membrane protein assembly factor BamB